MKQLVLATLLVALTTQAAESRVQKGKIAMHMHKPVDLEAAKAAAQKRQEAWKLAGKALELVAVEPFGAGLVEHWQLANGMQVLLAPDEQVPVVAVHSWLNVGSADELNGKSGLAHLFEHLMFKSTQTRPAGTLDRVLEQMGGSANAATSLDFTYYHATVPTTHLGTVLELEADRLVHLDLSAAAFRSELSVVKNERREVVDNDPDGQMDELLGTLAWGGHPYGHPVVGTERDLGTLAVADARQFYQTHYAASRLVLVLAGGFEPEQALTQILTYYAELPGQPRPQKPVVPAPTAGAQQSLGLDASTERLAVAWRIPPGDHADIAALDVLAHVLAGSDSTRLARALVFDQPMASHVSADISGARLGGLLQVHVSLLPGELAKTALQRVDLVLAGVPGNQPVLATELAAAKNHLKMEMFAALASVDGRAEQLGQSLVSFGSLKPVLNAQMAIDAVTLADVQRVAKLYLRADRRVVILGEAPPPKVAGKSRKLRTRG